ncbi:MAG: PE domain-containing protein [Pseudonocardiaceae bacterium]
MGGAGGGQSGSLPGMPGGSAAAASAPVQKQYEHPGYPHPNTTTGGGAFSVDPELAPQAIADLRRAAQALKDEAMKARDLMNMRTPGLDQVSKNAVAIFVDAAVGEYGSVRQALLAAAHRFESDANKLEASLRAYLGADNYSIPQARTLDFKG